MTQSTQLNSGIIVSLGITVYTIIQHLQHAQYMKVLLYDGTSEKAWLLHMKHQVAEKWPRFNLLGERERGFSLKCCNFSWDDISEINMSSTNPHIVVHVA